MKRLLFLLAILCITSYAAQSQTPLTEAVDFTAVDVDGETWNLFSVLDSGQYVVIDFFFCACSPCQDIAPFVNESYEYFGCNTGDVHYFAIDYGDDNAACIAFDETYGVHFTTISGVEGGGTQICQAYGMGAFPTLILIAPDHSIVEQDIRPIDSAQVIIDVLEGYGLQQQDCPPPFAVSEETAAHITIHNIYPNPFSSSATIHFSLEETGRVLIRIYDICGREVAVLEDTEMEAGNHQLVWEPGHGIPDGLYFCSISTTENKVLSKVTLSR